MRRRKRVPACNPRMKGARMNFWISGSIILAKPFRDLIQAASPILHDKRRLRGRKGEGEGDPLVGPGGVGARTIGTNSMGPGAQLLSKY